MCRNILRGNWPILSCLLLSTLLPLVHIISFYQWPIRSSYPVPSLSLIPILAYLATDTQCLREMVGEEARGQPRTSERRRRLESWLIDRSTVPILSFILQSPLHSSSCRVRSSSVTDNWCIPYLYSRLTRITSDSVSVYLTVHWLLRMRSCTKVKSVRCGIVWIPRHSCPEWKRKRGTGIFLSPSLSSSSVSSLTLLDSFVTRFVHTLGLVFGFTYYIYSFALYNSSFNFMCFFQYSFKPALSPPPFLMFNLLS